MAKRARKMNTPRLRVKYAEANRVRLHLLSEDVQALSKKDVQILLKILDDVYPVGEPQTRQVWQPLLIGIAIGLLLILGLALML